MNPIHKAGARLADYVYAGWRQLRGLLSRRGSFDFQSGTLTPVLVIPGVYERWHFMLPLIRELHELGHPVHVVDALRDNHVPVVKGASLVSAYLAERDLHDVVIVAHSKGGLIGTHVMVFGDPAHRVRQMVAIATPFGGSRYALLFLGRTLRAFSPKDETLVRLTGELSANARITSVYPRFDPHIPEGSELAGARNVQIDGSGHFRVLRNYATRAEVARVASS